MLWAFNNWEIVGHDCSPIVICFKDKRPAMIARGMERPRGAPVVSGRDDVIGRVGFFRFSFWLSHLQKDKTPEKTRARVERDYLTIS